MTHNRIVNGVVLSNGQRAWYDIAHINSKGGDLEQWKGSGNKEKFTHSHN